jgi:superfamily II DNA helicase RecQ
MRNQNLEKANLLFLVADLRTPACDKTIVFVTSKAAATDLFEWFHGELQDEGVYELHGTVVGLKVDMYSSCTEDDAKSHILAEFRKPNTFLRVLIATIAFGLGGIYL